MKIRVRLNESPSKKEGKSGTIAAAGGLLAGASMKALPKRKGNLEVSADTDPDSPAASMKALPKRKGIGVPRLRI